MFFNFLPALILWHDLFHPLEPKICSEFNFGCYSFLLCVRASIRVRRILIPEINHHILILPTWRRCFTWTQTTRQQRVNKGYICCSAAEDWCLSVGRSNLIFGLNFFLSKLLTNPGSRNLSEFCFWPGPSPKFVRTLLPTSKLPQNGSKMVQKCTKNLFRYTVIFWYFYKTNMLLPPSSYSV
jgi:hypothetical protein